MVDSKLRNILDLLINFGGIFEDENKILEVALESP